MNKFYVYAHYKTGEKDIPFYIGKGHGIRAYRKGKSRGAHWRNVVNKYGYEIRLLAEHLSEIDAMWLERKLIGMFGRDDLGNGPLVNKTDGGEGPSGQIVTEEQKKKISKSLKGKNTWMKGRILPEETIKRMEKARIGRKSPMEGKVHSDETKEKMSKAHMGNKSGLGHKHTEEHKQKIRESMKETLRKKRESNAK